MQKLIQKYNRPGPRYTSYPPVPFWRDAPDQDLWIQHLQSTYDEATGLDLYVHVPYCESLCYYCGCNRTITKDHTVEDGYLRLVLREWELYQKLLGFTPKINSLHFGGGTPTFLSPTNLKRLIMELTQERGPDFVGSIEIDPRTCQKEHLEVLSEMGITRVSLGIQDFDFEVQKAIHRQQPVSMVKGLVEKLRTLNFNSLNFDLIYGLPKQSVNTISETIKIVAELRPDLIAFYSYAHLPDRIKNQRLIKEADLPSPELKRELYETGKRLLQEAGYVDIGMDHFALPGSFLYEAQKKNKLHRNFMGYVDKKSPILIGLGPTAISDSSLSFMQNEKEIKDYAAKIERGVLPVEKGHTHSEQDLIVQKIILDLLCRQTVNVSLSDLPASAEIAQELSHFQDDGLIDFDGREMVVTPTGKAFVRNIAMSFDHYLRTEKKQIRFSQTI